MGAAESPSRLAILGALALAFLALGVPDTASARTLERALCGEPQPTECGRIDGLYYEVWHPSRFHEGARSRGTMLMFHQGGWRSSEEAVREEDEKDHRPSFAHRFARWGWRVLSVEVEDHRGSISSSLDWWRYMRSRWHSPFCTTGQSSGGHLALMLAVRRNVDCVLNESGATSPDTLVGYPRELAERSFGDGDPSTSADLRYASPARRADEIPRRTRVVNGLESQVGYLDSPPNFQNQGRVFERARPRNTSTRYLDPADEFAGRWYVHVYVVRDQLVLLRAKQRRVLDGESAR